MPLLGAHMSIAGGLPRAVDRAYASRCDALQIFTKSAGQWRARELPRDEVIRFRRRVEETGIQPVVAHTAGQETNLGHRFEHLAAILEHAGGSSRIGVCLDTCHLLTAGYDLCSDAG